jgi:hypothetical protein
LSDVEFTEAEGVLWGWAVEKTGMTRLPLNGAACQTRDDFYDALFDVLGAPNWHGRIFNVLRDSIDIRR